MRGVETAAKQTGARPYRRHLGPCLAASAYLPLVRRKPLESDRPTCMQPARRDPDLSAQPEFAAIGELRRGVVHDDGGIDFIEETLGRINIAGDNGVGVVGGMARNVC